jgi:beta-lactam-binding protein with PASTA domain
MSSPEPPSTGAQQVLSGRYEIHRKIARGGMAEVFLARDRSLDRPVAVKVLFPEFATDPAFVERFRREAQAAANLSHPNIVGVYDWGAENSTYFIVMEFVDGKSLAEIVRTSGPLHPRRAAEVAFEVAGALGFAHAKGVVHRDVKPGNVIISTSGVSKVTDFGIARALSSPSEDLTAAGAVMGTASYFSPEQAQGFPVDARSDLYSLGVVLFELVTGRAPFTGDSPVAIAYKHVQEQPPRPSDLVAGVPVGLEAIIGRLLAKQPDNRYRSADDLRADLRRWLDGDTPLALAAVQGGNADPAATVAVAGLAGAAAGAAMADATRVDTAAVPPPTGAVPVAELVEEEEPPRRTALFITLLVILLAVVAGLVFWLVSSLDEKNDAVKNIEVPGLVDLTQAQAEKAVTDAKLTPKSVQKANDTVAEGIVFDQSPNEGDLLARGDEVVITVSSGPETTAIPSGLVLQTYDVAAAKLQAAGFTNPVRQDIEDDEMPVGLVIRTDPTEGTLTPLSSPVNVYVSTGPAGKSIPTVAGLTTAQAKTALTNDGFKVGDTVEQPSNDVEKGRVIGTDPTGKAPEGSTINLIVSTGAQQVAVPSVKGQTEAEATATLKGKGLEVEVDPTTLPAGDPNIGRVIDADPKAGTMVDPGSVVTITVGVAGSSTTVAPNQQSSTTTSP